MYALIARLAQLFQTQADRRQLSPAAALMESADDSVGHDPRRARELREAASAWLRVVR